MCGNSKSVKSVYIKREKVSIVSVPQRPSERAKERRGRDGMKQNGIPVTLPVRKPAEQPVER